MGMYGYLSGLSLCWSCDGLVTWPFPKPEEGSGCIRQHSLNRPRQVVLQFLYVVLRNSSSGVLNDIPKPFFGCWLLYTILCQDDPTLLKK